LSKAVAEADLLNESVPERLELKRKVHPSSSMQTINQNLPTKEQSHQCHERMWGRWRLFRANAMPAKSLRLHEHILNKYKNQPVQTSEKLS